MSTPSRQLSGLCAACARSMSIASRASRASGPAARSFSSQPRNRTQRPIIQASASHPQRLAQSRAMQRAAFSSSSAASRASAQSSTQANSQREAMSADAEVRTQVPPSPPSYYALFPQTLPDGPPPAGSFHIDVRALRREFLQLQAASHPDFHHHAAAASSAEADGSGDADPKARYSESRRKAEAISAHINAAYKTLSNPLLRAQYLLHEQFSVDLAGDEASEMAIPDQELLMTVLEARETIENAEAEEDLAEVQQENDERIEESEEALSGAFAKNDVEAAKAEAIRLRYWVNIKESVDNWERGKPIVLQH